MLILEQAQKIAGHSLEIRSLQEFKRDNEVHTLSGDNTELRETLGEEISHPILDTLGWMIASAT